MIWVIWNHTFKQIINIISCFFQMSACLFCMPSGFSFAARSSTSIFQLISCLVSNLRHRVIWNEFEAVGLGMPGPQGLNHLAISGQKGVAKEGNPVIRRVFSSPFLKFIPEEIFVWCCPTSLQLWNHLLSALLKPCVFPPCTGNNTFFKWCHHSCPLFDSSLELFGKK